MFRPALIILLILAFIGLSGFPASAQPVTAPMPAVKPSSLTPIADQINQQIQSLIGVTTAPPANNNAPSANTTTSQNANGPNAAAAATTTGASTNEETSEPAETFGTQALSLVLNVANLLAEQGAIFADNFADLPQVNDWLNRQESNPNLVDRWRAAGQDLLFTVGAALGVAFLFELLLLSARRHLRRRRPDNVMRRLAVGLGVLAVELLPVILFVAVSLTLLNEFETQRLPRFVVLNVIYAITLRRLVMLVGQLLLAPRADGLRLVPVAKEQAGYLQRWLGLFSFVAVYGYFIVDVGHSIHVPEPAVNAFRSLIGFVLVIMTIIIIVQKRAAVAVFLRGGLSAAKRDLTPLQSMRLWFARSWHILAIAYLVIGYLVTAFGAEGGFAILLRGTILTFLILVVTGLIFHNLNRHELKQTATQGTPEFYQIILRYIIRATIWLVALTAIVASWGANISAFFATSFGHRVTGSLFSIGITIILLTLIYKYFNTAVERHLHRQDADGQPLPISSRARTLLPMLRNTAFILFTITIGMVILSEVGVNIGPLLAGAGVIGVAIGFGSQTLVKDFLTGLFIVLEGTIAVGDVVKIGTHSGVVEAMSVRTVRMRDGDGAVHVLPYSEVSQIINMTKDFAYALFNTSVAYETDLRHAMEVIKAVGEDLRQDAKFKNSIIDPIEVFGVDSFGDSAIVIQSRIRTRPGRQWDVKRAFLLRLKERFDAEKIVIPYPTSMQYSKMLSNQTDKDQTNKG